MEIKDIIELMKAVSDYALTSFELEQGDTKITMKREKKVVTGGAGVGVSAEAVALGQAVAGQMVAGQAMAGQMLAGQAMASQMLAGQPVQNLAAKAVTENIVPGNSDHTAIIGDVASDQVVACPLVGTFYSAPSPDAEDYVKIGDRVKKGQVLGLVEAMKLMNEIESEFDGVVDAVLVKDGEVVEYGQPLFRIR